MNTKSAMPSIKELVLHADRTVPEKRRDGKRFGLHTGLRRLAFLDELLYANYRRQKTDRELLHELKSEFKRESDFQPIKKYRYYFNTAHPQHNMGIGRPLSSSEALPEFGDGPGCVPVGTLTPPPSILNTRESHNGKHLGVESPNNAPLTSKAAIKSRYGDLTAIEGQKTEILRLVSKRHRGLRNRVLNEAKGICCVCGTNFSQLLGGLGVRVLQVHHRNQLASCDLPRLTTFDDLAVVCANCHVLLHLNPKQASTIDALRQLLRTQ